MFWYNVISHNSSYYFKMHISEIKKKSLLDCCTEKFLLNEEFIPGKKKLDIEETYLNIIKLYMTSPQLTSYSTVIT